MGEGHSRQDEDVFIRCHFGPCLHGYKHSEKFWDIKENKLKFEDKEIAWKREHRTKESLIFYMVFLPFFAFNDHSFILFQNYISYK